MQGVMESPIKILIDEISDAFSQYDSVNADYAAFASMALDEFKTAMASPELTGPQLRKLLRDGHRQHRLIEAPNSSWSSFLAHYVTQNVNMNELPEDA